MPIAFTCTCGASLSVPDSLSGKNGWCPTCGAILTVPVKDKKKEPTLRFACPGCKKTLRVALRLAGTSGKCGSCGWVFTVGGDPEKLKEKLSGRQKKKASGRQPEPAEPAELPPPMPDYFSSDDDVTDVKVRCECGVLWAHVPGDPVAACPACGKPLPEEGG